MSSREFHLSREKAETEAFVRREEETSKRETKRKNYKGKIFLRRCSRGAKF